MAKTLIELIWYVIDLIDWMVYITIRTAQDSCHWLLWKLSGSPRVVILEDTGSEIHVGSMKWGRITESRVIQLRSK